MKFMGAGMADLEPIQRQIRIGVTGHRKLDDPAAMLALVKKAIDAEVCNLFPDDRRRGMERRASAGRSEERRVGKECRSRWSPSHLKKKTVRKTRALTGTRRITPATAIGAQPARR